jgi:predicted Rossmann fold flavoprotein
MSENPERVDLLVVGAGAAGLMAAIFAARAARESRRPARVVAVDGAVRLGAKILVAGGGRCNVTHDVVHPEDFNGASRNLVARVLRSFTVEQTVEFFGSLGVRLKREEGGKLFPTTDRARTVLEALVSAASTAGAELREATRVTSVAMSGDRFLVETKRGRFDSTALVLATGGRSVPKSGSDGFGYELARTLGHSVTETWPALVPLLLPKGHLVDGAERDERRCRIDAQRRARSAAAP